MSRLDVCHQPWRHYVIMCKPTADVSTSQVGCVQDAVRKWQIILVYNIRCICLLGFCLLATAEPFEKATLCFPNLDMIALQLHSLLLFGFYSSLLWQSI